MLKGMPQTASQLLRVFPNQAGVTRGLGFYEIWSTLSSITLNNDYLEAHVVVEGSVLLIRKHQPSTE